MEDYLAKKLASNDALIPPMYRTSKVKMSDWLNTVYFYIQYPQRIKEIIRDKNRREVSARYDDGKGSLHLKKQKNYGKFRNWSDLPPGFGQNYGKNDLFFLDTRPLFEHFGDFILFYH